MKNRILIAAIACVGLAACGKKQLPELPKRIMQPPLPAEVDAIVFIVGDMGAALWERSPMPHRMARDVEWWSRALGRDSSVAVVFLGDNIYPAGLHEPHEREWAQDSAHLDAQVRILDTPAARQYEAFGVFTAGNHDWGHKFGPGGERRIRNQQDFLERRRVRGLHVGILPPDAQPGPGVLDIGTRLRILLIDTAWWLLSANVAEKEALMQRMQMELARRGPREIMIGAHHPMRSASSHGGITSIWSAFGLKWLLNRTGAALQDLNSLPYRDFLDRMNGIFKVTGPPLLFAGGHDHSLQVLRAVNETEPRWMVVSGAGSKSSTVGHTDGMQYRSLEPGYMMLVMKKDGGVDLFVYTAPPGFLMCDLSTPDIQRQCVEAGASEFSIKYGAHLK